MASLETRVAELERAVPTARKRHIVIAGVSEANGAPRWFRNISTGEEIIQGENESDAEFAVRAAAAGFAEPASFR